MSDDSINPLSPGQRVWWVWPTGDERSGIVVSCGRYDVVVDPDIDPDVELRLPVAKLSFASTEVFATPLLAWTDYQQKVSVWIDHYSREMHLWIGRRSKAYDAIIKYEEQSNG